MGEVSWSELHYGLRLVKARKKKTLYIFRHLHRECGATSGEADGATTGGSRIVGRLKRFRNGVLERELLDDGRKPTRNPGDEAWAKRNNDIKRRV